MKPQVVDFPAGLKTLRGKLGLTQEGMALRLGASLGTYRKWEAGAFNPSGPWLIKILQACPDEEARVLLGAPPAPAALTANHPSPPSVIRTDLRSSIDHRPLPNGQPSEPPLPTRSTLMARYRNVCIEDIELLYELARGGSDVARDHLQSIAEVVSRRVGSLTRADLHDVTRNLSRPVPSPAPSNTSGKTPAPPARRKPAR
jgi:transcriptional regulator with XRE-family HTH domain